MAELDLHSLRATIVNLMSKHNTNTSDYNLGNGVYKNPVSIVAGYHDDKPTKNIEFPKIWVELKSKSDEYSVIGDNNKRTSTINFDVSLAVQTGLGQGGGKEVSDSEMIKLSNNVEKLFRNHIKLSTTALVMESLLVSTEYDTTEGQDFYNSMARIGLEVTTFGT